MLRRNAMRIVAIAPATTLVNALARETFPAQTITIVVPYAAGGNVDVMARLVAVPMAKLLGQPVLVDNRPGAGGVIGQDFVARAESNGYTLLCTANGSLTTAPRMLKKRPFITADFAAVGAISSTPMVVATAPSARFKSMGQLIAYAKAHPEQVSIAHPGNGSTNHVAILKLQEATGARFIIVAYKGSAPALGDVMGGQVDAMVDQLPSALPFIKAKKLTALGVISPEAAPDLPDVKPIAEMGFRNVDITTVTGLLAPARTPQAILEILNRALALAMSDLEVQRRMKDLGAKPLVGSRQKFNEYVTSEDKAAEALFQQGLLKPE